MYNDKFEKEIKSSSPEDDFSEKEINLFAKRCQDG